MNTLDPPVAEHSEWNMTEEPMTKEEENDLYDLLSRECSVRNACGCEGTVEKPDSFSSRLKSINQMFEKGTLQHELTVSRDTECDKPFVESLLSRFLHPQVIDDLKKGDFSNPSTMHQGMPAWDSVRSYCGDAVPVSITQYFQ